MLKAENSSQCMHGPLGNTPSFTRARRPLCTRDLQPQTRFHCSLSTYFFQARHSSHLTRLKQKRESHLSALHLPGGSCLVLGGLLLFNMQAQHTGCAVFLQGGVGQAPPTRTPLAMAGAKPLAAWYSLFQHVQSLAPGAADTRGFGNTWIW